MRLVVRGHGNAIVKDNASDATSDKRVSASLWLLLENG
jgi:hypothetical protein